MDVEADEEGSGEGGEVEDVVELGETTPDRALKENHQPTNILVAFVGKSTIMESPVRKNVVLRKKTPRIEPPVPTVDYLRQIVSKRPHNTNTSSPPPKLNTSL